MKSNVILVGMPGSGKSTIGKLLSKETGMDFLDIDDYIEETTKEKVGTILSRLGDEDFLDYESKIVQDIDVKNTIISTSGSVPLRQDGMNHLRKSGMSFLIDIPLAQVYARLQRMKVERIVGMNKMTLEEILEYRKMFYQMSCDYVFSTDFSKAKSEIFKDFLEFFETLEFASCCK